MAEYVSSAAVEGVSSTNDSDKQYCTPLPNNFPDNMIQKLYLEAISENNEGETLDSFNYRASCGCMILLKKALTRLVKRQTIPEPNNGDMSEIIHKIAKRLTNNAPVLDTWTPQDLRVAIYILEEKETVLSGPLQNALNREPIFPPLHSLAEDGTPIKPSGLGPDHGLNHSILRGRKKPTVSSNRTLLFRQRFVEQVNTYHLGVKRPAKEDTATATAGAGSDTARAMYALLQEDGRLPELARSARELCAKCKGKRQVYCGACGGLRLEVSAEMLPVRVPLPFDVLLALHWQESLHRCTGVHSRVLATHSQVDYVHWEKDRWGPLVESWRADRDVLLFPTDNAVDAGEFQWNGPMPAATGAEEATGQPRYRLIVLEASWNYGATMARQIMEWRAEKGLPPLQCIKLSNIVGKYWRFQEFGHAAVSTIEAITCAVLAAMQSNFALTPVEAEEEELRQEMLGRTHKDMLLLFNLQKYRVLDNVASHGGKPPRAMKVQGEGDASWANVFVLKQDGEGNSNSGHKPSSHTDIDSVASLSYNFVAGNIYNNNTTY